jgi:group I intron endonuclease
MIIYLIENLVNHKRYVGKTIQTLEERFYQHCSRNIPTMPITSAIKKYGSDNFKISILENVTDENSLNSREIFWIEEMNPEYNILKGGNGGKTKGFSGRKHSETTKAKMKTIHAEHYDGRFDKFVFAGEKNGMSKLSNQQARQLIKDMIQTSLSNKELGDKYGLNKGYISLVRNKRRWKSIWKSMEEESSLVLT